MAQPDGEKTNAAAKAGIIACASADRHSFAGIIAAIAGAQGAAKSQTIADDRAARYARGWPI